MCSDSTAPEPARPSWSHTLTVGKPGMSKSLQTAVLVS